MSTMRGLVQFIGELRNAKARDEEDKRINLELANIRQKFKDPSLNGYQKKKYVCKLLYIYTTGRTVDLGHVEALSLMSSNIYSEKQIGYLAISLLLNETDELLHLVVNSIGKDLESPNELFNCLALHCIANVGNQEMAEALSHDVYSLLTAPTTGPFVQKKAALTLLRLYRRHPPVVEKRYADRIISKIDSPDIGVMTSAISLITALTSDRPDQYKVAFSKAAVALDRLLSDRKYTRDYVYYGVPSPWLQVKLLVLLQYCTPEKEDETVLALIYRCIRMILDNTSTPGRNTQQSNAQNAVLFEAINLSIHMRNCDNDIMQQVVDRLGYFISSRETNVRYLGLATMAYLASTSSELVPTLRPFRDTAVYSLRDKDISVRRKALDFLYYMCDRNNVEKVVADLLKYLQVAEFAIREEIAVKIAVLVERHATSYHWYIDTSFRLLAIAGEYVSEDVWERIIQIVTNNEDLQSYAAQMVVRYLNVPGVHENMVKVGAYILGEFGHLVAEDPGLLPTDQFSVLQNRFAFCSSATKAMVLSAFVKFANLFPEIKPELIQVFETYAKTTDSELQQRACEYYAMVSIPGDELLKVVFDEMPPFPERKSRLLNRLQDTRAKDLKLKPAASSLNNDGENVSKPRYAPPQALAGFDFDSVQLTRISDSSTGGSNDGVDKIYLSADWDIGFNRLLTRPAGIFYEDRFLQIGLRTQRRKFVGGILLYFTNKSGTPFQSFTTSISNTNNQSLLVATSNIPRTTIAARTKEQQMLIVEAIHIFSESPIIRISYISGTLRTLNLRLPVVLSWFLEPTRLGKDEFFYLWRQIGQASEGHEPDSPALQFQEVCSIGPNCSPSILRSESSETVIAGFNWGVCADIDTAKNPDNVVAAGVLYTKQDDSDVRLDLGFPPIGMNERNNNVFSNSNEVYDDEDDDENKQGPLGARLAAGGRHVDSPVGSIPEHKIYCLLRFEPNVTTGQFRLTIRTSKAGVSHLLAKHLVDRIRFGRDGRNSQIGYT